LYESSIRIWFTKQSHLFVLPVRLQMKDTSNSHPPTHSHTQTHTHKSTLLNVLTVTPWSSSSPVPTGPGLHPLVHLLLLYNIPTQRYTLYLTAHNRAFRRRLTSDPIDSIWLLHRASIYFFVAVEHAQPEMSAVTSCQWKLLTSWN